MYTCEDVFWDSIFTSIFSSAFVGPNILQRWGHHAAGVGKTEATQGKETLEHQRRHDQGGHDERSVPQCEHQQQEGGPGESQVHDEVCHAGEEDPASGTETGEDLTFFVLCNKYFLGRSR